MEHDGYELCVVLVYCLLFQASEFRDHLKIRLVQSDFSVEVEGGRKSMRKRPPTMAVLRQDDYIFTRFFSG